MMTNRRDFIKSCATVVPCAYLTPSTKETLAKDVPTEPLIKESPTKEQGHLSVMRSGDTLHIHIVLAPRSDDGSLVLTKNQIPKHYFAVKIAPSLYSCIRLDDFWTGPTTEQQKQVFWRRVATILGFSHAVETTSIDFFIKCDKNISDMLLKDAISNVDHWRLVNVGFTVSGDIKDVSDVVHHAHNATFEKDGYCWLLDEYEYETRILERTSTVLPDYVDYL